MGLVTDLLVEVGIQGAAQTLVEVALVGAAAAFSVDRVRQARKDD